MWEYKHPFHGKPYCSSKWKFWILGFCWTCCDCSVFFILSTTNICKVRLTVVVVILCYKVNGKIKTFPSKEKLWNIWMHVHHLHMFQDTCTMSQHLYCPRLISKTFHFHFLNVRKKRLIVVLLVFKHSAKFYIIFSEVRKFIFSRAQLSVKLKF